MNAILAAVTLVGGCGLSATAASGSVEFKRPGADGKALIAAMSDNGQWALSEGGAIEEGSLRPSGGTLYRISDMKETAIHADSQWAGVSDVTDDGQMVAGEVDGKPAYWSASTDQWTKLSIPSGYSTGRLTAITPDGTRAVGYVVPADNEFGAYPVVYDLPSGERRQLTGLPVLDMNHDDMHQNAFTDLSADGRYAIGTLSISYLQPRAMCAYVYDIQEGTYQMIGFTENDIEDWTSHVDGLYFVDGAHISPNGEWVTGIAYMVHDDGEVSDEYRVAYRFHRPDGAFEVFEGEGETDMAGRVVDNAGTVLAAAPALNPYPTLMVRHGKHYFSIEEVVAQAYGEDLFARTGQDISGAVYAVSADGRTIASGTQVGSYIVVLPDPVGEACEGVNLLNTFTAVPAAGSTFSVMQNVTLAFGRTIEVAGKASNIRFVDSEGNTIRTAIGANLDAAGSKLSINFRATELESGKTYKVVIPAGFIHLAGDDQMTSEEIVLEYNGLTPGHIALTEIFPADGAKIAKLDINTSYVLLTFNATVKKADNAEAYLYRGDDAEPFCSLYIGTQGNQALVTPMSVQYLYEGTDYRVVVPAGQITDIAGYSPNEEIVLHLSGSYVREISQDDKYLFNDDCSTYANYMFYKGTFNEPSSVPASWGFTANNAAVAVMDDTDNSQNLAMAMHSMYTPAGQADDWMIIPQLLIPDERCVLAFDAQSYLTSKQDRLRVYILPSEKNYNEADGELVEAIRATTPVIDTVLTPGQSEESLAGDWQHFAHSLEAYAGQRVYVAFSNYNYDQSAMFIDNVQISHDIDYLVSLTNDERVVAQDDIEIKGTVTANSELKTFQTATLRLLDAEGTEVSKISASNLNLAKGDHYTFAFPERLPLTVGRENKFSVEVDLDGDLSTLSSTVKNLAFRPTKRVLIEEFSGMSCSNCPRGFRAMEHLEETYPGQILPVIIRTYGGDKMTSGLGGYSQWLGLDGMGAPSASIDRTVICGPMPHDDVAGVYVFSANELSAPDASSNPQDSWYDVATSILAQPTEADLDVTAATLSADGKTITIDAALNFAMDAADQNLALFGVVTENNLEAFQSNGMSQDASPAMGEWGKGGIYGSSVVKFIISDVARGIVGNSYAGTPGLLPTEFTGGQPSEFTVSAQLPAYVEKSWETEVTLVVIDANTDRIINSGRLAVDASAGVDNVAVDGAESFAPCTVYNLQGLRVLEAASEADIQTLPAGIYVANGRKYLVR